MRGFRALAIATAATAAACVEGGEPDSALVPGSQEPSSMSELHGEPNTRRPKGQARRMKRSGGGYRGEHDDEDEDVDDGVESQFGGVADNTPFPSDNGDGANPAPYGETGSDAGPAQASNEQGKTHKKSFLGKVLKTIKKITGLTKTRRAPQRLKRRGGAPPTSNNNTQVASGGVAKDLGAPTSTSTSYRQAPVAHPVGLTSKSDVLNETKTTKQEGVAVPQRFRRPVVRLRKKGQHVAKLIVDEHRRGFHEGQKSLESIEEGSEPKEPSDAQGVVQSDAPSMLESSRQIAQGVVQSDAPSMLESSMQIAQKPILNEVPQKLETGQVSEQSLQ